MSEELVRLRLEGDRGAAREIVRLAEAHPGAWIAWYDQRLEPWLSDPASWPALARHGLEVLHLGCFQRTDLVAGSLGFVDFDSPWLLPGPTDRRFDTWLISPAAGLVRAAAVRALAPDARWKSLAGFLFDLGGRGIRHGLFPCSEPALLRGPVPEEVWAALRTPLSASDLALLIRRGHGRRWLGFWLLARLIFHRRLPVAAALRGWLAAEPGRTDEETLAGLHPPVSGNDPNVSVDVIIPTLGRPEPLRDVLDDLGNQTLPPRRVIVVDQGGATPKPVGVWPFELVFLSLPDPGACRARNSGLREVRSEWVLLLDDDVRLRPGLISYLVRIGRAYGAEAVNAAVHLPNQNPATAAAALPRPWPAFASGASLVSARALRVVGGFDERLEGGYGEDYELGVRLRQAGVTVLLAPGEPVLHLKAPAGGFRERTERLPWSGDRVPPRPAPPVLYSRRKHHSRTMQDGYRLFYTLKRLRGRPFHVWPREIRALRREWESSARWAGRMLAGAEP
jgi:hypothetical protein